MKNFPIKCLLLILHTCSFSDKLSAQTEENENYQGTIRSILQRQAQQTSHQKTTATHYRLAATSITENGALIDSSSYYYSNGRGSKYFNSHVDWMIEYSDKIYIPFTNPANQPIQCDSSYNKHNNGSVIISKSYYTYNSNNIPIQMRYISSDQVYDQQWDIYYNSMGNRDSILLTKFSTGAPIRKYSYQYNAQKKILLYQIHSPAGQPMSKTEYNYDTKGNIIEYRIYNFSSGWQLGAIVKFSYDNTSRLIYSENKILNGTNIIMGWADSFYYAGSAAQPVRHEYYEYDVSLLKWEMITYETHHLNAQNIIDTIRAYERAPLGGYKHTELRAIRYFNGDLIDKISFHKWDGLIIGLPREDPNQYKAVPYKVHLRYYKQYTPSITTEIIAKKKHIVLYPNPVKDQLHIKTGIASGTVTVHNMLGQTVFSKQFTALNGSSIDMSAYPAGQYILRISNDAGEQVHTQQLTKR